MMETRRFRPGADLGERHGKARHTSAAVHNGFSRYSPERKSQGGENIRLYRPAVSGCSCGEKAVRIAAYPAQQSRVG